ncbi:MAG: eukaryotic translation initiation factor EIF4E family protein [archaeon]|nr:eukaryotic translation initiation factor EIF4E family protein [archaeon]
MENTLPLNSTWSFYYASRKEKDYHINYKERCQPVAEFSTMEDFFKVYLKIKPINEIGHCCDLSVFKKGYEPMWESCTNAGIWMFRFKRTDDLKEVQQQWEKIIFSLITEKFNEVNILGTTLSIRSRENLVEIWFNYFRRESIKNSVLNILKTLFNEYKSDALFYFKDVNQSLNEGSTLRNVETYFTSKTSGQTRKFTFK